MNSAATVSKSSKFKKVISTFFEETFKKPLFLITHPIGGWSDFKYYKQGKMWVSLFYLVMMVFAVVISAVGTGFLAGGNVNLNDFNVVLTMSYVLLPVALVTIGNWCITALFYGKGNLKEIFMTVCYSFFPFVWLSLFATILSNFIILDEVMYVTFLNGFGAVLLAYMVFFGFQGIHEYGLFMNIINILFTIIAICVILFIALLFMSLIQQMSGWIMMIINELKMRYF